MKENRKMKELAVAVFSVLLLSMGYSGNFEIFASTVQQEKQDIIDELENFKNDDKINKKSKKNLESAIKKLEKSLNSKYWKDESTVNFKHGKKVLNADQQAVKKLENILKDKKSSSEIKEGINNINISITQLDKALVGNAINELEEIIMSKKGIKKIDKAIEKFEKGNKFLEDEKYSQALKNYAKAWDQIKKSLKDPHFKKMRIVELEGVADMNFDNIPDVYLKVSKSAKDNKPKLLEMKITGECVNGSNHNDARMKIGLSTPIRLSTEFFDGGFDATNKWFKQNDPDKRIDPVVITTISEYFSFPESGDDLIQINDETGKGSFDFTSDPINEIGDQSGWTGKFTFDGEPGDYSLHFWFPLTEPTIDGDNCNFVSNFSIPTEFE
jgi:tetratricopeptide (TPR) repeat protein